MDLCYNYDMNPVKNYKRAIDIVSSIIFSRREKYLVQTHGFTLIELLITIGIVAVIAAGLFVALNPAKRIGDSNDARRKTDLESIARAIELYTADYGAPPSQIAAAGIQSGQKYVLCSSSSTLTCNGQSNTCQVVTDTNFIGPYLGDLPIDPTKTATTDTGYYITRSNTNTLILGACSSYSGSVQIASRVNLPTYVASVACGDGSVGGAEVCDYTGTVCPNNASYSYAGYVYDGVTCTSSKYACNTASCNACITQAACLGTCDSGGVYSGGYCWYQAPDDATSCTTVCASHAGCTVSTWNDNASCAIANAFLTCSICSSVASNKAPYFDVGTSACYYRASGSGACTGTVGVPGFNRICACNK